MNSSMQGLHSIAKPWGEDWSDVDFKSDIITGGDLIYDTKSHQPLLQTLQNICLPHTLIFLSFRKRGETLCLSFKLQ